MDNPNEVLLSSLLESVCSGDLPVVRQILESEPCLLAQRERSGDGWAAIHHAVAAGQLDIVTMLLRAGCSPDLPSGEDDGEGNFEPGTRPLSIAAWKDQLPAAKLLLNHGADPNGLDRFGHSAVHVAAAHNHLSILNVLLAHGADPNLESDRRHFDEELGWYFYGHPLHVAALNNSVEAARVLLAHGAARDACWIDQRTPLFYAAATGSTGAARVLLEAGANSNAREDRVGYGSRFDYTPLHYAANNGHLEVVKALLEFGADTSLVETNQGATARQLAYSNGHQQIVALLESQTRTPPTTPRQK